MPIPLAAAPVVAKATSPMWAPLLAGGLSALGSVGSSLIGRSSAKNQMRFQERMSNTSHKREMADLKKSGLNPLLTGKYGGSTTPPGTSFTPENPLAKASQSAMEMKMLQANLKNLEQNVLTNSALESKHWADEQNTGMKTQTEEITQKLMKLQINEAKSQSDLYKNIGQSGKAGKMLMPLLLKLLSK